MIGMNSYIYVGGPDWNITLKAGAQVFHEQWVQSPVPPDTFPYYKVGHTLVKWVPKKLVPALLIFLNFCILRMGNPMASWPVLL